MEQSETFLACPFCGGTNILVSSPGIGMVQPRHFVAICTNDVDKPGCGSSSTWKLVPAEAREAWNRRAGAGRASQDNGGKQLVSSAWLDAAGAALSMLGKASGSMAREKDEELRELYYHAGRTLQEALRRGTAAASNGRAKPRGELC